MALSNAKPPFDPAKGCQVPWTGMLGGFLILGYSICYAIFWAQTLPGGGPRIDHGLGLLPAMFQASHISRDFYDIMALVLLGFLFMVTREFLRRRLERVLALSISALGLASALGAALGADWFFEGKTAVFLGWEWTRFEVIIALNAGGLLFLWLHPVHSWLKSEARNRAAPVGWALKTSFFRWLAGVIAFTLVLLLALTHPFYTNRFYQKWQYTCGYLYLGFLFFGWPYGFITNLFRRSTGEDRKDPNFILLLILRNMLFFFRRRSRTNLRRALNNRVVRIVFRDLLVKIFFLPIMVAFLFLEFRGFSKSLSQLINYTGQISMECFQHIYWFAFHGLFIMDISLAMIGYGCSSRWLDNKSRSVEPTLGGWLVAVACYPPFNTLVNNYLPHSLQFKGAAYFNFAEWSWLSEPTAYYLNAGFDVLFGVIALSCYFVFVWATMAFGLRFSNLTHRGIITRGPYAWVRHPAYAAKNIAWWAESIRRFTSPWQFIFLAAWNIIYYWRAMTEERHLSQDPHYQSYCRRVRYKFLPKIW